MLFDALLPLLPYLDANSEKVAGNAANFAKLLGANLHSPSPWTPRNGEKRNV
ncbi:hypothetical protein SAMN04488498_13323 [Mesorhizobium albiziae]|uniref:Uncharacterized protein n=1 Tax=Neomesorhizobium albiziae TaxID=335020 RepID=A0A1I4F0L7_9HYPH|nr:hypothetical protein SAMN04488498_13323 [Mesorhizobium albiziae]